MSVITRVRAAIPAPVKVALRWGTRVVGSGARSVAAGWGRAADFHRFREVRRCAGLRLHLGCGDDIKEGWVNIDLVRMRDVAVPRDTWYLAHDLRRRVPLADGSCSMVYSSHFLEHLEYADAVSLLKECRRVLQDGGLFRISMPAYRRVFAAYLAGDEGYFGLLDVYGATPGLAPGTAVLADYVSYAVFEQGGHKHLYDQDKLRQMLIAAGFGSVCESTFKAGMDPGSELRRRYSFYMEARR